MSCNRSSGNTTGCNAPQSKKKGKKTKPMPQPQLTTATCATCRQIKTSNYNCLRRATATTVTAHDAGQAPKKKKPKTDAHAKTTAAGNPNSDSDSKSSRSNPAKRNGGAPQASQCNNERSLCSDSRLALDSHVCPALPLSASLPASLPLLSFPSRLTRLCRGQFTLHTQ